MSENPIADIAGELAAITDRLDEIALAELRDAVADGRTSRPEIERRVVRARNAIERARRILEGAPLHENSDDQQ